MFNQVAENNMCSVSDFITSTETLDLLRDMVVNPKIYSRSGAVCFDGSELQMHVERVGRYDDGVVEAVVTLESKPFRCRAASDCEALQKAIILALQSRNPL